MTEFDREKARDVLEGFLALDAPSNADVNAALDALAASVVPTTPDIDRDALMNVLRDLVSARHVGGIGVWADRILALVQPVPGITLSPDEAALAAMWMRALDQAGAVWGPNSHALAAKLEAAS